MSNLYPTPDPDRVNAEARKVAEEWNDVAEKRFNNGDEAAFGVDEDSFAAGAEWFATQQAQIAHERWSYIVASFLMDFEQMAFHKTRSGWTGDNNHDFTPEEITEFTRTYGAWADMLETKLNQANHRNNTQNSETSPDDE